MSDLNLTVVTPNGAFPSVVCDSIHLSVQDNQKGKGGGRYGIRPGHQQSLLSVAEGKIEAFVKEQSVFCARCGTGFATVQNNTVTLVVESCSQE